VRDLENQLTDTVRKLRQALADLDDACARHFDMPRADPIVGVVPRDPRQPDWSGWQPPAQDSDEVDARVAARQALVAHGEQVAAQAGGQRPLPAGVVRRERA
jgi:hypothetical protein